MIYIIGSLLIAKPDNMETLKQSIFSTKEFIENAKEDLQKQKTEMDTKR